MSPNICSVDGCEKALHGHGLCPMHLLRLRTHGDVNVCTTNRYVPMEERFWMKVQKTPDCWNWTASRRGDYGRFTDYRGGKTQSAHRWAYEFLVGQVPDGKQLDHICHNTLCVNPDHLRPVTPKQNMENRDGAHRNSKTGIRGVSYNTKNRRFVAFTKHYGKPVYGGSYHTAAEAAEAVKALRLSLHTHNDADRKSA